MSNFKLFFDFYSDYSNISAQFKEGVPKKQGQKNIVFVNPSLTGNNFYKLVLPCMMLKNVNGVYTALTGIHKYNPTKRFVSRESPLSSPQLLWADTIVFPFVDEPLGQCFTDIRRINPGIKIIFSMDFNIYELHETHPYKKYFSSKEQIQNIDVNIANADEVIVTNVLLEKYLNARMKLFTPKVTTKVTTIPILFDEATQTGQMEEPKQEEKKQDTKLRIGVMATDAHLTELKSYNTTLKTISKKFADKAEIIVFGTNPNLPEFKDAVKGYSFIHEYPVPITLYYEKLSALKFDVVIMLTSDSEFCKTSEDHKKFIDLSLNKVPVITLNSPPYSNIFPEKTQPAFVVKHKTDIVRQIESIITDRKLAVSMGASAYKFVLQTSGYDEKNYARLLSIF